MNGKTVVGQVAGPAERLDLLQHLLPERVEGTAVAATLLPKSLTSFAGLAEAKRAEVQALLDAGRQLVERVERLVCSLYEVPDELADEVVAHAVARSASAPSTGESTLDGEDAAEA